MEFTIDENNIFFTTFREVKGTLSKVDSELLVSLARSLPENSKYLEIGSYLGCSSLLVAWHSDAIVYSHDIWVTDWSELKNSSPPPQCDDYFYKFYKMVIDNNLETQIIPIRGQSSYTIGIHKDESIDLAFIDGDHSYEGCYLDLVSVYKKVKIGGSILIHDCYESSETLKAVLDFTTLYNIINFTKIEGSCGMIIFKK